jgi:geranylgeranyl pyrophosphate synthase/predicted secreted hydrolase
VSGRPSDWPSDGPIDLSLHDLPHASAGIEWWYVNAHLVTDDGRTSSLFASFFRLAGKDANDGTGRHQHYLTCAFVDATGKRYLYDTLLDPSAPEEGIRRIDRGRGGNDGRTRRALREVFARGRVPHPDRLLVTDAAVRLDRLSLDYDGNCFVKQSDGSYRLTLAGMSGQNACDLEFHPMKPATRHGHDGVTSAGTDHEMFYYFVPRCRVEGTVTLDGSPAAVASGAGWYDHEFGDVGGEDEGPGVGGLWWHWIAAQLDDGTELTAFEIVDSDDGGKVTERRVITVDAQGARTEHVDFTFEPEASWVSCRTFDEYPTAWHFEVPALALSLDVRAEFEAQEYLTLLSPPAFWEGRVRIWGTKASRPVTGLGFVERTGFSRVDKLDDFFSAVGRETRTAIDALLPAAPTRDDAERLLTDGERPGQLDGFDVELFGRVVLGPIRELTHRGGKAWRSYGVLAAIDAVGGDPHRFRHWLALPELLHTGSLIIDDVQDRSEVRRGGPAVHTVHGEATAINAGCAAYFLALAPLLRDKLSDRELARIYEAYFQAMRAAHAGQALDIHGLEHLMPGVVETGAGALVEERILAIHRLKSGVGPAALARVAALVGGGTNAQVQGIGELFESLGLAFQIVDDTLNLRGFRGELKVRGEDIRAGKVTLPVAKAMSRLGLAERRALWEGISARPTDAPAVARLIETIEVCGALDACDGQARALVESAWQRLDPLIVDSHVKIRLRAFGWFILERHY